MLAVPAPEHNRHDQPMAIDRSVIGETAARFLDDLEQKYGERGSLDAVVMIVAVDNGEKDDTVEYRIYDGAGSGLAAWKAKGLLTMVTDSIGP
jgi:hypothetical protein